MIDPAKTSIFLGPPGTGKTTKLLSIVEEALAAGTSPREIGFISFTKKAAEEGKERAVARFGLPETDFPHFKTLHAMAFRHLGMSRDRVFGWQHTKELGQKLGMEFKGKGQVADDDVYGMNSADRCLFLEGVARNRLQPLREAWRVAFEDAIDWWELERFAKAMEVYKESRGLLDFTDMLERFCMASPTQMPKFKLLVIDEAQDLSLLQWKAVDLLARNAEQVYVGGDDDQAIYSWAGADVATFIDLQGSSSVLDVSYRVPASVHKVADSITRRISSRRQKVWSPRDEKGSVNWFGSVDEVDMSKGSWLLLARNGYMLDSMENFCLSEGFSFHSVNRDPLKSPALQAIKVWENLRRGESLSTEQVLEFAKYMTPLQIAPALVKKIKEQDSSEQWSMGELRLQGLRTEELWWKALVKISAKERDFFLMARKRGEPLLKKPRITISTIHAAKGGEADHVLLASDISYRSFVNMQDDPDSEARTFYVAVTRCRESLNILTPKTNLSYEI